MANNFIPFSKPDISELELQAVEKVLRSGWLSTGPSVKAFEEEFASYISPTNKSLRAVSVSSATAGLHLALEACGIKQGDEIITSTLTFTATAAAARFLGAEVKLVDINQESLNIDVDKIESVITPKTKAIIPVHYAGLSCDMDQIYEISKKYDLRVIEDAAHALPTKYKGKMIGDLKSDATVFSFYANKTMTTGEGGMVLTNKDEIANRVSIMRSHGISRDAFDRFTSKAPSWYYEVIHPGYKYNMNDISASIGISQLKRLPDFLSRRNDLATRYIQGLKSLPLVLPEFPSKGNDHAWHLFVIRLSEGTSLTRDEVIDSLSNQGIGTSVHYVPLHMHPYWKSRYELEDSMFEIANKAYGRMISIPLYTAMKNEEQERIIQALTQIFLSKD